MIDELLRWGWLLAIATNLLLGWIGWSLRKQFLTRAEADERFAAIAASVNAAVASFQAAERDVANRLTRVEAEVAAAPSHADLSRIHDRLNHIADVTGRLEGALKPLDRLTSLLTQAQLDRERAR